MVGHSSIQNDTTIEHGELITRNGATENTEEEKDDMCEICSRTSKH